MTHDLKTVEEIAPRQVGDPLPDLAMADPAIAASAYKFGDLAQYVEFAKVMCQAGEMLPPHARRNPSICLALTMRAVHWGFDPFALAEETYQAKNGGPVGYQAKVFSAVLRKNGVRLRYRYEGEITILDTPVKSYKGNKIAERTATGDRKCIAYIIEDGEELAYETMTLDQITIKNSPLWHNDPDQQLSYAAARGWARRYRPDLMMGAYDEDEVQGMKDVTPEPQSAPQSGFAQLAMDARKKAEQATSDEEAKPDEQNAGEDEPAQDEEPEQSNEQAADPIDLEAAKCAGRDACFEGFDRDTCPHDKASELHGAWLEGWDEASTEQGSE
jgi:ribosome modulation factor